MTRLRAAVVGFGWAGRQHMAGYDACPDTDLVAICGQEDELGGELQTKYDVAQRFVTLDELLAATEVDVISIATPNATHAPLTIAALDAGVNVLCEKPMALSADQARAMVEAAERNHRVLDVSFNHRFRGVVQALKSAIDDGLLGEVYYAKAGWVRRQGIPGLGTWFSRRELAGGGPFMDIGVHMADLALYLTGEPSVTTVSASAYAKFGPRGMGGSASYLAVGDASNITFEVEDLATAFCRLDNGSTLTLEASWAQWLTNDLIYVDLFGSEAGAQLRWSYGDKPDTLTIATDVRGRPAVVVPAIPESGSHTDTIVAFVATVLAARAGSALPERPSNTSERLVHRCQIVDAVYASATAGHEVTI